MSPVPSVGKAYSMLIRMKNIERSNVRPLASLLIQPTSMLAPSLSIFLATPFMLGLALLMLLVLVLVLPHPSMLVLHPTQIQGTFLQQITKGISLRELTMSLPTRNL